MPILYMQEECLLIKYGIPVELIYRNGMRILRKNFPQRGSCQGKSSEIFPESMRTSALPLK